MEVQHTTGGESSRTIESRLQSSFPAGSRQQFCRQLLDRKEDLSTDSPQRPVNKVGGSDQFARSSRPLEACKDNGQANAIHRSTLDSRNIAVQSWDRCKIIAKTEYRQAVSSRFFVSDQSVEVVSRAGFEPATH